MNLRPFHCALAALALILTACSSFTPQATVDEASLDRWVLAQEKDKTTIITLTRGMTPEVVANLLGKPLFKKPLKKASRPSEEWTYRRYTLGGYSMGSARSKQGTVTVTQRVTYVETLELTFVDGQLSKVHTSRYREDSEPNSPMRRL